MVSAGSDLFHEAIRVEEIEAVFNVMAKATQHHFEVITKRIERMETLTARRLTWPSNVMAGVTVEETKYKWRLDCLRGIDARRFVSFGPMTGRIGKVDLTGIEVAGVVVEAWGKPRPVKQEWIDEIHKQCDEQKVRIAKQHWLTQEVA
jgi:protein gp37